MTSPEGRIVQMMIGDSSSPDGLPLCKKPHFKSFPKSRYERQKKTSQTDRQTDFHTPNALLENTSLLMPPADAGGQKRFHDLFHAWTFDEARFRLMLGEM